MARRRPRLSSYAPLLGACFAAAISSACTSAETDLAPVPQVTARDVLQRLGAGKKVVFVDAREPEEFLEEHIPGAINVPLRDIGRLQRGALGDSDLVIAYCLKDFRGFEMSRSLRQVGYAQAAILKEFGIAGWKRAGLPTVKRDAIDEATGLANLRRCADHADACLRGPA